ncbi:MAG: GrpB family protein [Candidatus Hodarchaeota archaeon]
MSRKFNIVDYDPEWNKLFIKEKNELEKIFGDLVCSIHHVGSTAIKTTQAKPEIDILIVVKDDSNLAKYDKQMIDLGYRVRGECLDKGGIPGKFYYSKNTNNVRTHKVHICKKGHEEIMKMLLFVKCLNEHEDCGRQYADLKQKLSKKYNYDHKDIGKYIEEKSVFIRDILERARKEYKDIEYHDFL